jgi:fluoride ion exporter CrcB/FEX
MMVGLAGGLTTFSTLAVLMIPRTTEKFAVRVATPLTLHLIAGVAACALGFIATQGLL